MLASALLIFSPLGGQTAIYHNYVQLYETLHLEMAAHFQKVTETGQSLKQVFLRYKIRDVSEFSKTR